MVPSFGETPYSVSVSGSVRGEVVLARASNAWGKCHDFFWKAGHCVCRVLTQRRYGIRTTGTARGIFSRIVWLFTLIRAIQQLESQTLRRKRGQIAMWLGAMAWGDVFRWAAAEVRERHAVAPRAADWA